jgi:hypothetical protein
VSQRFTVIRRTNASAVSSNVIAFELPLAVARRQSGTVHVGNHFKQAANKPEPVGPSSHSSASTHHAPRIPGQSGPRINSNSPCKVLHAPSKSTGVPYLFNGVPKSTAGNGYRDRRGPRSGHLPVKGRPKPTVTTSGPRVGLVTQHLQTTVLDVEHPALASGRITDPPPSRADLPPRKQNDNNGLKGSRIFSYP